MGTYSEDIFKMKLSLCVLAGAAYARSAKSGKPEQLDSGKPMSGRPYSGHNEHNMKEEYGEFKDMMAGVNQQNMMNVNFAPINNNAQNWVNINTEVETEVDVNVNSDGKKKKKEGDEHYDEHDEEHDHDEQDWKDIEEWWQIDWKSDKMMWLKKMWMSKIHDMVMYKVWEWQYMMEPHMPLLKELLKNMTGRDCDEWKLYIEETYLDGHSFEDIVMWYQEGHIDMNDLKEWARAICYGIQDYMENMSEEEIQQQMDEKREFLAMFGMTPRKSRPASRSGWACPSKTSNSVLRTRKWTMMDSMTTKKMTKTNFPVK